MEIPFRRIVGLIAMGLVAGALLRLIHQALQKMKGRTGALRGGVLATFEVEGERFRVWTTNLQPSTTSTNCNGVRAQPTSPTGVFCADPGGPDTMLRTTGT